MKKFGKIITLVLALMLAFSLGACGKGGDDKKNDGDDGKDEIVRVNTVSQAYDGAIKALLDEDQFTAKIDVNASGEKHSGSFAVKKADGSYDYKLSGKKNGDAAETVFSLKKGNIIYNTDLSEAGYFGTGYSEITQKEISDGLKSAVSELSGAGTLSYADGTYTVDYGKIDYSDIFKNAQSFLVQNKDVKLRDFVTSLLGNQDYTGEDLFADLDAIFAPDPVSGYASVSSAIKGLDTLIGHITGLPLTVDLVADMLFSQFEITAQDIYALFVQYGITDAGNVPDLGQTPYGYLYAVCKDFPLNDIISQAAEFIKIYFGSASPDIQPAMDDPDQVGIDYVALIRAKITEIFGAEGWTVGDFYNNVLDFVANIASKVLADKIEQEQINTIIGFIKLPALEKLEFGENSFSAKAELDAKNLSFKKIIFTADNNISLKTPAGSVPAFKSDIDVEITFDYESAVEITAPAEGTIEPCMTGEIDMTDLPQSGDFRIPVFTGKGFVYTKIECTADGEPIEGVSYADGNITVSAAAISEIRAAYELDAEIIIKISFARGSDSENLLILECTID